MWWPSWPYQLFWLALFLFVIIFNPFCDCENTESDFFSHTSSFNKLLNFSGFSLLICKTGLMVDAGLLRERSTRRQAMSPNVWLRGSCSLLCKQKVEAGLRVIARGHYCSSDWALIVLKGDSLWLFLFHLSSNSVSVVKKVLSGSKKKDFQRFWKVIVTLNTGIVVPSTNLFFNCLGFFFHLKSFFLYFLNKIIYF